LDPATILAWVLWGAVALAIGFEIKTHINEARRKAKPAGLEILPKKSQAAVESEIAKKKAA